jgi:hypothetical protein
MVPIRLIGVGKGWAGWPTLAPPHQCPRCVPDASFDFESALASSIVQEELHGHLDSGEMGCGLFSPSPLTSPKPKPPPSPAQQPTLLDSKDLPSIGSLSPADPQRMPGDSSATAFDPPGGVKRDTAATR